MVIMVFKISRLSLVVNMRVWSFAYSGFSTFDILVSIYTHFFFHSTLTYAYNYTFPMNKPLNTL